MVYQEVVPHPRLSAYVVDYWLFKVPPAETLGKAEVEHMAPADGCVSLLLFYRQAQSFKMALVTGPTTEAIRVTVEPDSVYLGIRFLPGMFCALFDDKGLNLKNQKLPAQHLLPDLDLQPLLRCLTPTIDDFSFLDDFLLQLLAQKAPIRFDAEVNKAVRMIMASGGNASIRSVLEKACLSERQLQKRFKRCTYLSLKELAKICRLRHVISKVHLERKPIADAVYEAGYFDQAHYNHDLHQITRCKPEDFYSHISRIKHVDVKPIQQKPE